MTVTSATTTQTTNASKTTDGTLASEQGKQVFGDNLNNFLTLLTTQLKNQDPTSPLDTNQMTQQLVSFASVEQQVHMNQNLESLIGIQETNQKSQAVSYIGKLVEAEGNVIQTTGTGSKFTYELADEAKTLSMNIMSDSGNVLYTQIINNPKTGKQEFTWNGKNNSGGTVANGSYKIVANAVDQNGNSVLVKTYARGVVDAVDLSDGNIKLSVGGNSVSLDEVYKIGAYTATQ